MASSADRLVLVETLLLAGALVIVYHLDTPVLWLGWATVTVAISGATLLSLNWFDDSQERPPSTATGTDRESMERDSQAGESVVDSAQSVDASGQAGSTDDA